MAITCACNDHLLVHASVAIVGCVLLCVGARCNLMHELLLLWSIHPVCVYNNSSGNVHTRPR